MERADPGDLSAKIDNATNILYKVNILYTAITFLASDPPLQPHFKLNISLRDPKSEDCTIFPAVGEVCSPRYISILTVRTVASSHQ